MIVDDGALYHYHYNFILSSTNTHHRKTIGDSKVILGLVALTLTDA